MWPSIRKHVLSTKAFFRGFEVTLKPFRNAFETVWKHFWNPLETLLKPLWNPLKPCGNPFEMFWNPLETLLKMLWHPFEMLWNSLETLLKRLGTWKHFGNPLEMFCILFEKPLWKCWKKNYSNCSLCSPSTCWQMRESTACEILWQNFWTFTNVSRNTGRLLLINDPCRLHVELDTNFSCEYFVCFWVWFDIDSFIVLERSKIKRLWNLVAKISDIYECKWRG